MTEQAPEVRPLLRKPVNIDREGGALTSKEPLQAQYEVEL